MGTNPYEAPRAEITGCAPPPPEAAAGAAPLSPEMENRATQLLGAKRARASGVSLAVAGAACIGVSAVLLGVLLGFIVGGALATVISKASVKARTPGMIKEVCVELGIPPWAFQPEKYLI